MYFIISGYSQSGTTSLYRYLAGHPQINPSKIKETNCLINFYEKSCLNKTYNECFDESKCQIKLDASPAYMRHIDLFSDNLNQLNEEFKVLLVIRDPVERAQTIFNKLRVQTNLIKPSATFLDFALSVTQNVYNEKVFANKPNFIEVKQRVDVGFYSKSIQKLMKNIKKDQLEIVFFEELKNKPKSLMVKISNFVGVDSSYFENYLFKRENKTRLPKSLLINKLVLWLSFKSELYLNKTPVVKKVIKKVYLNYFVKEARFNNCPEGLEMLSRYFSASKVELKYQLRKISVYNLPSWLS